MLEFFPLSYVYGLANVGVIGKCLLLHKKRVRQITCNVAVW